MSGIPGHRLCMAALFYQGLAKRTTCWIYKNTNARAKYKFRLRMNIWNISFWVQKFFYDITFKGISKILLACIFHIIISNLWERDLQSVKCPRAFGRSTIWAQFYKIVEKRKCNLFCFRYLRADYNTWWSRKENN